tara:strand:+ start:3251 stop:3526 length:276 start_codon:yes stop_codon:yes gene_type:complete
MSGFDLMCRICKIINVWNQYHYDFICTNCYDKMIKITGKCWYCKKMKSDCVLSFTAHRHKTNPKLLIICKKCCERDFEESHTRMSNKEVFV